MPVAKSAGGFDADNRRSNEVAPAACQLSVGDTVTPTWPFAEMLGTAGRGPEGFGGGAALDPATTLIEVTLKPAVSKSSVICCRPAPSVTGTPTVVQFCHPPVAGIATDVQTLFAALKPTCSEPPPGDATRSCAV